MESKSGSYVSGSHYPRCGRLRTIPGRLERVVYPNFERIAAVSFGVPEEKSAELVGPFGYTNDSASAMGVG